MIIIFSTFVDQGGRFIGFYAGHTGTGKGYPSWTNRLEDAYSFDSMDEAETMAGEINELVEPNIYIAQIDGAL